MLTESSTTVTTARNFQHGIPNLSCFTDNANDIMNVALQCIEGERSPKTFCAARYSAADRVSSTEEVEVSEKIAFPPVILNLYGTSTGPSASANHWLLCSCREQDPMTSLHAS